MMHNPLEEEIAWIKSKELATLEANGKGLGFVKIEDAILALENLEYKMSAYYEQLNNSKNYFSY